VTLLIIDEIHLLGGDRGPVLEVIVSRTNYISAHTAHKVMLAAGMSAGGGRASHFAPV
jgi:activating signal cointegrator complex subunit 3